MAHVRTTLRAYRVKNPAEFPLLVRRIEDDNRSGERFLADRIGASISDLLRPSSVPDEPFRWALVRHRLLDGLIRYLSSNLSSRLPDSELMPLERLAERIRESRLRPDVRASTEETILDLTESLLFYYDLLSPETEEEVEEKAEETEVVARTRLLDEISRLIKRRPELPSERFAKRSRRIGGHAMSGALDESL
jgi:uncharacterized membrane protein YccC